MLKLGVAAFLVFLATATTVQTFNTLVSFDGNNGYNPVMSLVQGHDGNLYGTTTGGGITGNGTIFKITPQGKLTTLYSFCAQRSCPDLPFAGLLLATDGDLYGTTIAGGFNNQGTLFKAASKGVSTLYSFCAQPYCRDGIVPEGALVEGRDGRFYGTTKGGGFEKNGTIFSISPGGALKTLYKFQGKNGSEPEAPLVETGDGSFYGTTVFGGAYGSGTVFKITASGKLITLHSFAGAEGFYPVALVLGNDGNLYGTTAFGGGYTFGTFFKVTSDGSFTTLYSFCTQTNCTDGNEPNGGLVQATDGSFYGATVYGGDITCNAPLGCGTLFRITPAGTLTTMHNFEGMDGRDAEGMFQHTNGKLYGSTYLGGANDEGTLFVLDAGLGPFVAFVRPYGKVGQTGGILGQGLTGATAVSFNGIQANFTVVADTFLQATVPEGASSGYVTVVTANGTLTSNVPFQILP